MKTFGLTLNLKDDPETIETYKEHHRSVWPEVEAALKTVGIRAMRIFLLGRRVFMYMETGDDFNPDVDFPRYLEQHPRCKAWDELMCTYQEKVPEAGDDEWWAGMEEVYYLR